MFKLNKKTLLISLAASVLAVSTNGWAAYGLLDVYQLAANHDAQLAQARAEYEANQQVVDTARAPLLPQISVDGSYNRNDSSRDESDVDTRDLSLNLRQSLYKHDSWARFSQAEYNLKQASYGIRAAEQDLIVRVANAYFKVLLAQEDVKLAISKEEADKTQWDRAKASAEVGLASKTDVLQAKSSFDLSKSDRISAENNLDVSYEELMKLTGKSVRDLKVIALNAKLPPLDLNISDYEMKAQQTNLDVLQAIEAANAASEEIEVQASGHWFDVEVRASYSDKAYSNFENSATSAFSYNDRNDLNVGVYASLPLYSGGGVSSQVSAARAKYKAATIAIRDAKETARLNARVEVRNVQSGFKLIDANRTAVQSNDAFLEAAEEGYKVGLKDLLEVLTARTNKFQARRNLASSLHNVVLSRLKLEAAIGELDAEKLEAFERVLSDPIDNLTPPVDPQ